jgi:hypothetical protein
LKGEGHDFAHAVCHSIFITQGLSWRVWHHTPPSVSGYGFR